MVFNYLKEELLKIKNHQCDETNYQVIMDGRSAGSKGFIWAHLSSELCDCAPIVIFEFELTRGTDHLREFYKDFEVFITSDGYCAYKVLEKEEIVAICGCASHCRRRYVDGLNLVDIKRITKDKINDLIETKAILMLNDVYQADKALKDLTPDERKARRGVEVRPLVEKFFNFVESVDITDPSLSSKCVDAITYSRNHKKYLMRFLDNGNIPLDNNAAVRKIKSVCLLRKASLFSYSISGAEANCIMHSIVETAKANGADAYWYIRYILEVMPGKLDQTDRSFLSQITPWSPDYKTYEAEHKANIDSVLAYSNQEEAPRTPRKKDKKTSTKHQGITALL